MSIISWFTLGYGFAYGGDGKFVGDDKFFMINMCKHEYARWYVRYRLCICDLSQI